MASSYTGSANGGAQPPSPQPGPGTTPIISIPAGSDAPTIESIQQQMKADTDHITYIQKAAALSPAWSLNASVVGFTPIVHTGSGTGTCIPYYTSTNTYGGLNIVVKIILGGAVGTATYQLSTDGGNTYGSTTATAAVSALGGTGINANFSGTFVAADTYAFQQAFTPNLRFLDVYGVARFIVDHNGIDTGGRITRIDETWKATTSGFVTTSPLAAYPYLSFTRSGSVFTYQVTNGSNGATGAALFPCLEIYSGTTNAANENAWIAFTNTQLVPNSGNTKGITILEFEMCFTNVANTTAWIGFGSSANLSTSTDYIVMQYSSGGGFLLAAKTAGTPSTATLNSPALASGWNRVKLEFHESGTPLATTFGASTGMAVLFVNDQLATYIYGGLTTASLFLSFGHVAAASATATLYISPFSFRQFRCTNAVGNVV